MAWQDELRHLDDEMTAGRLSAEEYRRRRDELVAAAGTTPHATPEPPSSPHPPEKKSPFPPPFRWDTPATETTDFIEPVRIDDEDDLSAQTQVVRKPGQRSSTQQPPAQPPAPPPEDSESTQIVANAPPFPQPSYRPQPPAAHADLFTPASVTPASRSTSEDTSWRQQPTAPPWLAADPPPIRPPNTAWATQGPDFFRVNDNETGFLRIVAVTAAIVVLAGIGITAFFLFAPDDSDTAAPAATAPPAAAAGEATAQPAPPGPPIVDLPGELVDTSVIRSFSDVADLPRAANPLTREELEVLSDAEADELSFALSWDGETKINIMVIGVRDAAEVRDRLADLQRDFGLMDLRGLPAGVRASGDDRVSGAHPVLRRAHYASGDYLVRIEISDIGAAKAHRLFEEIVVAQQKALPADE